MRAPAKCWISGPAAGYHARVLASRGFDVLAVDTSDTLLRELSETCAGMAVTPLQADLLDEAQLQQRAPFTLILCVGDTLSHLSQFQDVDRLIRMAARLLEPGGALLLQFREQPRDLSPQEGIITLRAERDRIMQCVLHFEPQESLGDRYLPRVERAGLGDLEEHLSQAADGGGPGGRGGDLGRVERSVQRHADASACAGTDSQRLSLGKL